MKMEEEPGCLHYDTFQTDCRRSGRCHSGCNPSFSTASSVSPFNVFSAVSCITIIVFGNRHIKVSISIFFLHGSSIQERPLLLILTILCQRISSKMKGPKQSQCLVCFCLEVGPFSSSSFSPSSYQLHLTTPASWLPLVATSPPSGRSSNPSHLQPLSASLIFQPLV